jgi:hypothetical protein
MDNFQIAQSLTGMAHSNRMLPMYSTTTSNAMYARPISSQTYAQLDAKPAFPSAWTIPPYSEEISSVETYGLGQSSAYLTNPMPMSTPMPMTNSNMYNPGCRWTHPTTRAFQQAPNLYYDQETSYNGLSYESSHTVRDTDLDSPLNMTSLRMALPDRPHPRRSSGADGIAPQRQLPFPQPPNPVQTSRKNVLDELQGQRLRSGQAASVSSMGRSAFFVKPLLNLSAHNSSQINVSTATSSATPVSMPNTADGALDFLATTATDRDASVPGTTQLQLNFNSPALFDPLITPAPSASYSTFREERPHMPRQNSETNLYSFNPDSATKRNSTDGEESHDCKLVNGQSYIPLTGQPQQSTIVPESLQRESFENRQVSLLTSMTNLSSSF